MKKFLLKSLFLLCALVVGSGNLWATDVYQKIASTTQLVAGHDYILVNQAAVWSLGTWTSGNSNKDYYARTSVTPNNDLSLITDIKEAHVLRLGGASGAWTFYDINDSKYLSCNGDANGIQQSSTANANAQKWTIAIDDDGVATITNKSQTSRMLQYNGSSSRFACYKSSSNMSDGVLYAKRPSAPTFDRAAGPFYSAFDLTITAATGCTLKYTTDGSAPSTSETAIAVASNTTTVSINTTTTQVKAIAIIAGVNSTETDATYSFVDSSTPSAVVSATSLSFGEVEVGDSKELTFTVTPANLTSALSIASNNTKYTVSPTSIAQGVTTETTITVTAVPTAWDDVMDGSITISGGGLTENKSVTLTATPYQTANVTLVATDNKGTFKQGDNVVTSIVSRVGNTITIKAIPNDGYVFSSWSATGATPASSTTAQTEFTLTAASTTLTATFEVDPNSYFNITIPTRKTAASYGTLQTFQQDGLLWSTNANQPANYATLQMRKRNHSDGVSYIKLPELSGNIQNITLSVTGTSGTSKTDPGVASVFNFQTTDAANAAVIAASGNTTSNTKILDLSSLADNYSTGYITLATDASVGARVWEIIIAYIPTNINVSVTSAKYATFSDHVARDFSTSGITVLKAVPDNNGKVDLEEITDGIVPANEGVVLFSDDEVNAAIPATKATGTGDFSDNEMVANVVKTWITEDGGSSKVNYILSNGSNGVGFYKAKDTGANLAAHRAYLSTAATAGARDYLEFSFGETTGITKVENTKQNVESYYNLNGQRIANPTKGLYIVNGKKVVIK